MEISGSSNATDASLQVAVQKQVLDQMKVQGADLNKMMSSPSSSPTPPEGSVNSPSQGNNVDAQA
jgi:hypothetical protein